MVWIPLGMEPILERYKTAYSPLFKVFVDIKSVHYDDRDKAILTTQMEGSKMLFREYELTRYCL